MNKKLNNLKGMNKKLVIYILAAFIIVVGGIIVLMILKATIFGRISVDKLEGKIMIAAQNYFSDNKDKLPINDKDVATLTISDLVNNGYLKSLDKLLKNKSLTCSGNVTVTNNAGYYLYSPNVNCGDTYKTKKLYEVITASENIVNEKDGLYKVDNDYIYRGENVNNYVSFDDSLWRILKVNGDDNSIRMIKIEKTEERYVWDDRYNKERNSYIGINNFDVSRLKDTLLEYWKDEKAIKNINKCYISTQPLCTGARKENETDKTNKSDCLQNNGYYSLTLPLPSDYMIISLDSNCKYYDDNSCTNYNYLNDLVGSFWTSTPFSDNTYKVYKINSGIILSNTNTNAALRFVVNLSSEANFNGGDGTKDNPYTIK